MVSMGHTVGLSRHLSSLAATLVGSPKVGPQAFPETQHAHDRNVPLTARPAYQTVPDAANSPSLARGCNTAPCVLAKVPSPAPASHPAQKHVVSHPPVDPYQRSRTAASASSFPDRSDDTA